MSVYRTKPGWWGWCQMRIVDVWVGGVGLLSLPVPIVSRWQEAIFAILRLERVRGR